MKRYTTAFCCAVFAAFALLSAACSQTAGTPAAAKVSAQETYSDPFLYCKAVGAIDQPDGRYTGPKVPDPVIQGYIKAAGLTGTTMPPEMFQKSTIWRCMDNNVYACNFGANLPCDSKANTNRTPTQEITDFCKQNQSADFIPMAVTGHSTIYSWRCVKGAPEVLEQIDKADAAGYLTKIWYQIEP